VTKISIKKKTAVDLPVQS